VHVWFYKKGCQEKKLPRELEAAKSFASSLFGVGSDWRSESDLI
jgi:hypothetical protein